MSSDQKAAKMTLIVTAVVVVGMLVVDVLGIKYGWSTSRRGPKILTFSEAVAGLAGMIGWRIHERQQKSGVAARRQPAGPGGND